MNRTSILRAAILPALVLFLSITSAPAQPVITTAAGNGPDGAPAGDVGVVRPSALALDPLGNLYMAVAGGFVFRLDPSGLVSRIAGTGAEDPLGLGDGGPALDAGLTIHGGDASGLAADAAGTLYISETAAHRVRRVDAATGIITTIAGTGTAGFSGDGGPASAAELENPRGLALDGSGGLLIADSRNERVRRLDLSTGIIDTVIGGGPSGALGDGGPALSATLYLPAGLAIDGAGNILIAEGGHHRIRRVDITTGIIETIAGRGVAAHGGDGGPATLAWLAAPRGVSVDGTGRVFIADTGNHRIRMIDLSGVITTLAGTSTPVFGGDGGPATSASLSQPRAVLADTNGNVFIADAINNRIRRVDTFTGIIDTVAGHGGVLDRVCCPGTPATSRRFSISDMARDADENLFIASDSLVYRIDAATGFVEEVAGGGTLGDGVPATDSEVSAAEVEVTPGGDLLLMDRGTPIRPENGRIRKIDAATGIIDTVESFSQGLNAMELDAAGNLYVAPVLGWHVGPFGLPIWDSYSYEIIRIDASSGLRTTIPLSGFRTLTLDMDASGSLYIVDGHQVLKVDPATGAIDVIAGDGTQGFGGDGGPAGLASLDHPHSVEVTPSGTIYISDRRNLRIRRVDPATRIISTFAGDGRQTIAGDGGPADAASLALIDELLLDGSGNLYLRDASRIRRVDLDTTNQPPIANAGADRVVPCTIPDGSPVFLDGSASTDPDGDALLYGWTGAFPEGGGFITGLNPGVSLSIGPSIIDLFISDGQVSATDAASVTVTVEPVGLSAALAGLTPDGQAPPAPAGPFHPGRLLPLRLEVLCDGQAIGGDLVAAPRIVSLSVDGLALDPAQLDLTPGPDSGLLKFTSHGTTWTYNLWTRELLPGEYLMTIEMPDGRWFNAAFALGSRPRGRPSADRQSRSLDRKPPQKEPIMKEPRF